MSTHSVASPISAARLRVSSLSPWAAAVWLGAALYAVLLSIESVREFRRFETQWDLAIYDQLLWLLAHGHEPFSTVITRPMLEAHFQPALVLLTPLYWLDLGVPALLTAQSIGLALTAPALFALARHAGASPALAALPAFLWLVCPFVASVNLFEFRPDPFAPPLSPQLLPDYKASRLLSTSPSLSSLALLAPSWMLLSLPTALHNALSAYGVQHDLVHHYHLGTLTGLFVASAVGVGRLQRLSGRRRLPAYALAAVAALVAVGVGRSVHDPLGRTIPEEATAIERALERIPEDASVAATWSLVAHLSQRVEVYSLPEPFLSAEWGTSLTAAELAERAGRVRFVAYRDLDVLPSGGYSPPETLASVKRLLHRLGFVEIDRVGRVHILERAASES